MNHRFKVLRLAGIPVYVHELLLWFFVLLATFLALGVKDPSVALRTTGSALLALLSVLIHEAGHALQARRLGMPVTDISLHLFFGMTRMASPVSPREELLVGLSGPLANLVAAGLTAPLALWHSEGLGLDPMAPLSVVLTVNLFLGVLNLVPAFPMDGGRLMRALLSLALGHERATRIAILVSRLLAGAMILSPLVIGFSGAGPVIPVIGTVILVLGEAEARRAALSAEERRVGQLLRAVQSGRPTSRVDVPAVSGPGAGGDSPPAPVP